jgi:hypothetical protein
VSAAVAEAGLVADEGLILIRAEWAAVGAVHGRLSDPLPAVLYEVADRHAVILRASPDFSHATLPSMPTSMSGEHAVLFAVGDRAKGKYGYTYLAEWSTESFYLKSTWAPMQATKVSIHGPSAEHPDTYLYKADLEHDRVLRRAERAGCAWYAEQELPIVFPGRRVNDVTEHVLRYAVSSEMFDAEVPSAFAPKTRQKATVSVLIPIPAAGHTAFVDFYVSRREPYWVDEDLLRRCNAGLGPLTNSAGMHLTAVSTQVPIADYPDPFGDIRGDTPIDQCVRGCGEKTDDSGLLWICEKLIPRTVFEPQGSSAPPVN